MDSPLEKKKYENLDYLIKTAEADFNGFETQVFDGNKVIGKKPYQTTSEYLEDLKIQLEEQEYYQREPEDKLKVFQVPWVVNHAVLRRAPNERVVRPASASHDYVTCSDLDAVNYFEPKQLVLFLIDCLPVICQVCTDLEAAPDDSRAREATNYHREFMNNLEARLRKGQHSTMSDSVIRDFLEIYILYDSMKFSRAYDAAKAKRSELLGYLTRAASVYTQQTNALSLLVHLSASTHAVQTATNTSGDSSIDNLFLGIECMKLLVSFHNWLSFQHQRSRSTLTYADVERYRTRERLFDIAYIPKPSPKWPGIFPQLADGGGINNVRSWSKVLPVPMSTIDLIGIVRMFDTEFIRFLFHDYEDAAYYEPIYRSTRGRIQQCPAVASVVHSLQLGSVHKRHLENLKRLRCKIGVAVHEQNSDQVVMKSVSKQTGHPDLKPVDLSQLSLAYQVRRMFTFWQTFTNTDLKQSADADDTLATDNIVKLDFIAEPRFKNIENKYERQGTLENILDGMNNVNDIVHRRLLFEAIYSVQNSLLNYDEDIGHEFVTAHNEKLRMEQEAERKRSETGRMQYMSFVRDQFSSRSFEDHDDRKDILADVFYKPYDCRPPPTYGRDTRLPTDQVSRERLQFIKRIPKHHIFFVPLPDFEVPKSRNDVVDEYSYIVKDPDCAQNTLLGQDKNVVVVIVDSCYNKLLLFDPAYTTVDRKEVVTKVIVALLSMGIRFRRSSYLNQVSYNHRRLDYSSGAFHKPVDSFSDISRTRKLINLTNTAQQLIEDYSKANVLQINNQPAFRGVGPIKLTPEIELDNKIDADDRSAMGIEGRAYGSNTQSAKTRKAPTNKSGRGGRTNRGRGRGRGRTGGGLVPVTNDDRTKQRSNRLQWQVNPKQILPHLAVWYAVNYMLVKSSLPDPTAHFAYQKQSPYESEDNSSNALLPDGFINQMYKSTTFDTNPPIIFEKNIDKLFENLFNNFFRSQHRPLSGGVKTKNQKNQKKQNNTKTGGF